MDKLLYGVAYYDEYMPYDRLQEDVAMIKAAGINLERIAESTWSTCEPQEGVFDFSHVTRVLDAMEGGRHQCNYRNAYLCHPCVAGTVLSGYHGCDEGRQRPLRRKADRGHYTSGLSLLRGAGHP